MAVTDMDSATVMSATDIGRAGASPRSSRGRPIWRFPMRVFVTGASGWIGSAVVPELLAAGHQVVGLARSDRAAETITAMGAQVHRGTLDDVESFRSAVADSEGVVHLGYHHDFAQMAEAAEIDRRAITMFGDVLAGTDAP